MIQQKRFGRTMGLPSTVQIIRELKLLMRRGVDLVPDTAAGPADPTAQAIPSAAALSRRDGQ